MQNRQDASLPDQLKINEIFYSIQGESTYAGLPCVFIRLTGCNLRCSYCDTAYAFYEGEDKTFSEILAQIEGYKCRLVEITGGEPLIQKNVLPFVQMLCDSGYEVLLETGGHMDITALDSRVKRIVDIKCPSSGESQKVRWKNLDILTENDQLKFVLGDREDYLWAKDVIEEHALSGRCPLIMSPVFGKMDYAILAKWILEDHLPVRLQLQLHKYIWPPDARGV